jgi:hypothetical protein
MYPIEPRRFHAETRALLEEHGIDGRVPLRQARINAGLDMPGLKAAA